MKYIRIKKFNKRPDSWSAYGVMDCLMGKVLAVHKIDDDWKVVTGQVKGVTDTHWWFEKDHYTFATEKEFKECWAKPKQEPDDIINASMLIKLEEILELIKQRIEK